MATEEYFDVQSATQWNKILKLQFLILYFCCIFFDQNAGISSLTLTVVNLEIGTVVNLTLISALILWRPCTLARLLSNNWTLFNKDEKMTPITYSNCITRQVFYSFLSLLFLKNAGSRDNRPEGIEFYICFSFLWFHDTLKILDRTLWVLKLSICRCVILPDIPPSLKYK